MQDELLQPELSWSKAKAKHQQEIQQQQLQESPSSSLPQQQQQQQPQQQQYYHEKAASEEHPPPPLPPPTLRGGQGAASSGALLPMTSATSSLIFSTQQRRHSSMVAGGEAVLTSTSSAAAAAAVATSSATGFNRTRDVIDSLESLKHVSLQALNSLVVRLVQVEKGAPMAIPEIEPVAISINNHYATSISEQTSPLLVAASDTSDTKIDGSGSPPSLNNPSNSRLGAEISKILSMHSSLENMSQAAAASSKNNIILNTSPSYSKIPKTSSASSLHQSQKDLNLSSSSSSTSPLQIPKIHPSVSDSQVSKMEEIGEVDKDSSSLAVAAAVANNDSFSFRDMLKMEQDEEVGKQHGKAQNNHQKHLNPIATKPNSLPASSKSSRPASDTLSDDMKFSPEKISSPPSSKSSEKMNSVGSTSSSSSSPFALLGEAVKKLSETGRRFSMSAAATRMRDQQQQSIIPSTQLGAQTTGPTTKSGNIMDEELIAPLEHTLAAMQAVSATGQKSVTGSLNLLNSSEVGGFVLGPSSGTTTETSAPFSWSSSNSPTSAAGALSPGILNEQLSSSVGSNAVRLAGGVQCPESPTTVSDHDLALALAALCNGLYRLLETEYTRAIVAENQAAMHEATTNNNVVAAGDIAVADSAFTAIDGTTTNIASIQPENIARDSALHNHIMVGMSAVQNRRPESEMQEDERALWVELDRLMVAIKSIVQRRVHNHAQLRLASLPPPAYSDDSYTSPNSPDLVALGGVKQKDKKSAVQHHHHKHTASSSSIPDEEVGLLLSAIERVLIHAPRLNAQDFLMTEVQSKKLSGAVLANLVERLMKRSEGFENQRVDSTNSKFSTLNQLVSQITTAHKRSLVNQRAVLMPGHVEKIEMGKISKVVERQQKSRFPNQDWISPEARLIENLEKLNHELDNLASTLHTSNNSSAMNQQRFRMTEEKEKAMYISGVMGKMEKMGKQRLGNQDSMTPAQIKQEKFDELNKIMDRMTTASPLQDQRFTPKRS